MTQAPRRSGLTPGSYMRVTAEEIAFSPTSISRVSSARSSTNRKVGGSGGGAPGGSGVA